MRTNFIFNKQGLTLSLAVCLLASILFVSFSHFFSDKPIPHWSGPLDNQILRENNNWKVQDILLANTEENFQNIHEILQFDDYVLREYQINQYKLGLLVFYWKHNTITANEVQNHVPDICWVQNGWEIKEEINRHKLPTSNNLTIPDLEFRLFRKPNTPDQYVYYWHIVGKKSYFNKESKFGKGVFTLNSLKALFGLGLHMRDEQFFIRLTSNHPIESIWESKEIEPLIGSIFSLPQTKNIDPESE